MDEKHEFTITLEHREDFEFGVKFDWPDTADLLLDEPEPLGHRKGPNASRIAAAAVGNCLTASLFFCLRKSKVEPTKLGATVTGILRRNERGRMRIGEFRVRIRMEGTGEEPARVGRCLELFEDYCVVTDSIRNGVPVAVEVVDENGKVLTDQGA
jgi:uncharacterized OsmC-like protein